MRFMLPTSDGLPFTGQIMILVEAEIDLIAFSKKWSCGTEIIDYLSRLVYRQGGIWTTRPKDN